MGQLAHQTELCLSGWQDIEITVPFPLKSTHLGNRCTTCAFSPVVLNAFDCREVTLTLPSSVSSLKKDKKERKGGRNKGHNKYHIATETVGSVTPIDRAKFLTSVQSKWKGGYSAWIYVCPNVYLSKIGPHIYLCVCICSFMTATASNLQSCACMEQL